MLSRNIHKLPDSYFSDEKTDNHRRGGRMPMVAVQSSLGRVLDLSCCGAQIQKAKWRRPLAVDREVILEINAYRIQVEVKVRIARREKIRGLGHVYGIEFLEISELQRKQILDIANRGWPKRSLNYKASA